MSPGDRLPKKFEVRDLRNGDWAWVYKSVISDPHLTAQDFRVYSTLASFDGDNHRIFPSYDLIAKMAKVSRSTALRSIHNLVEVGYIGIEKGGGRKISNSYNLLKRLKGCQKCTVSKTVSGTTINSVRDDLERVSPVTPEQYTRTISSNNITAALGAAKSTATSRVDPNTKAIALEKAIAEAKMERGKMLTLDAPPITPEQKAENEAIIREISAKVARFKFTR